MQSPFITHRDKVLGHYSTAAWLRQFVLAMWGGSSYPVGLSQFASMDADHTAAALEMLAAYRQRGESDPAFMALADECRARLQEEQAAAERQERFDSWLGDVRVVLRSVGLRAGLADDRYEWFESHFDKGMQAHEAAQLAAREKLE
jgi:hypothetical protein